METRQVKPVRKNRTLKEVLKIYGFGIVVACLIMFFAYQFVEPAPPKTITIATAGADGAYYAFAKQYQRLFAKENIDLQVLATRYCHEQGTRQGPPAGPGDIRLC